MPRLVYFAFFMLILISLNFAASANTIVQNNQTANITVSGISVPSTIQMQSPLPVYFNMTNSGSLASGNITIMISTAGTQNLNYTFDLASLSPGQSKQVLIYLSNATRFDGKYIVYLNSQYIFAGSEHVSSRIFAPYTVVGASYVNGVTTLSSPLNLPNTELTFIPLFTYIMNSSSFLSQIGLANINASPESINVTTSSQFANLVALSARTLYLTRNTVLSTGFLFNSNMKASPGSYAVPISISFSNGSRQGSVQYVGIYVLNSSMNSSALGEQVDLGNNSRTASGVIQVHSPADYGLTDVLVRLFLPTNSVRSESSITPYGAQYQMSQQDGYYIVKWTLNDVSRGQSVYVYYDLQNVTNVQDLTDSQLLLSSTTPSTGQGVFTLESSQLPVLYVNSSNKLRFSMLYTGSSAGRVIFYLPQTSGIMVQNTTREINAVPNQLINQSFNITAANYSGTVLLTLYANAQGVNTSFSLPIEILPGTSSPISIFTKNLPIFKYLIFTIILIVVILAIYRWKGPPKQQKYSTEKAGKLIELREQIKRSSG